MRNPLLNVAIRPVRCPDAMYIGGVPQLPGPGSCVPGRKLNLTSR